MTCSYPWCGQTVTANADVPHAIGTAVYGMRTLFGSDYPLVLYCSEHVPGYAFREDDDVPDADE